MLLKYFYDKPLAHASYLVGCQKSGEALIVDPGRNIQPYIEAAKEEGLRIVGAAETHIHADFVSGSRELANRLGATLYLSDEGPAEWKYGFGSQHKIQPLKEGDHFSVGNIKLEVMHTPGHTPESVSFLLTDEGGGATEPMGLFTGDFIFVGSIGRPDLLETAAGVVGSADAGARDLFRSAGRFKTLPDYLQIWPAHGAGSACGKGLGAIPSSTSGYEKRFNPALQFTDEQEFVDYILSDQPETPRYFATMKRVNKEGPTLLEELKAPSVSSANAFLQHESSQPALDLRSMEQFAEAHADGTVNVPIARIAPWAGWLVDYEKPLRLIATAQQYADAIRILHAIGVDQIESRFDPEEMTLAGLMPKSIRSSHPAELRPLIEAGSVQVLDVRADTEWNGGHIPKAHHYFLGQLPTSLGHLDRNTQFVTQCLSGARSAIAASLLQAEGFDVIDMSGGLEAWKNAGFPIQQVNTMQPA
ncbi:MAG: MBL fold metallo-hydrolase [Rubripirellula sp.]